MPAQKTVWTAEMARALPDDGKRYEVLDGELFVSPVPSLRHQAAMGRTLFTIGEYCRAHYFGEALFSPSDIEFSEHRLLQPDVFAYPFVKGKRIREWSDIKSLLLAVEVVSPETARADRYHKRLIYQDEGVPDYWIVDLDSRTIEVWQPHDARPRVLDEWIEWHPVPDIAPLRIELSAFFKDFLG